MTRNNSLSIIASIEADRRSPLRMCNKDKRMRRREIKKIVRIPKVTAKKGNRFEIILNM